MGEQTQAQIQTQTQTQTQPQMPAQSDSLHDSIEQGNYTPPNPSPKTSSRPKKIRKIDNSDGKSPQNAAAEDPKATSTDTTTTTTTTTTTKATAPKSTKSKLVPQRLAMVPKVVARSLSCVGEVEIALRHLRAADPHLAALIDLHQPPTFDTFHTPFLALTKSILYQQLAYKAGTSIYTRFITLCGGESRVLPETILALDAQNLRQIGVSGRKASYLHDLARKYQNGILSDSKIVAMDDKSLFTMLTMVNGIGSWSVHMFMIFSLHRPDVLPINDLGIRKGVQLLYGLEELPRPSQMDQLCEKWRPYRSVASWYLWRFVEAKGTPSSAVAVANSASLQNQHQEEQQQQLQHQHDEQQQQPQFLDSISPWAAIAWGQ